LIEVDLGNLVAFDYQEYRPAGFDAKAVTQVALQELFNQLFQLPIKADEISMDPLAQLPNGKIAIPREKPVPAPKALTKWEQFRNEKGIKKKKKSRMIYDEISKEYRPRYGFNKPLNANEDWVMDDKPNELAKYNVQDPFELTKSLKKKENKKIAKHQDLNKKRKLASLGMSDRKQVTLELHNNERVEKEVLERAVSIAQKSTASMGKFDKLSEGEKKVKRKPDYVPDTTEERKKVETRIALRVIKNQEAVIDAKKAGNQLISTEQKNKRVKTSK